MAITTPGVTSGQRLSHDATPLLPPQTAAAHTETTAAPPCVEDITQQGIQAAQRSLAEDPSPETDANSVSQMQALLASPHFSINADALASSMLDFFTARRT